MTTAEDRETIVLVQLVDDAPLWLRTASLVFYVVQAALFCLVLATFVFFFVVGMWNASVNDVSGRRNGTES